MKNLVKAIEAEQKARLNEFINGLESINELKGLDTWQYNDLLPKGKKIHSFNSIEQAKKYLIERKQKQVYKSIEREAAQIAAVNNAGMLIGFRLQIKWKKSRTWGANPTAELWVQFKNKDGQQDSAYFKSRSVGGCGYDKRSTAAAEVFNQCNEILKPLYHQKNEAIDKKNHDLLGYGSGYFILPNFEGGVGIDCHRRIFEKLGYKFECTAGGKMFDAYQLSK